MNRVLISVRLGCLLAMTLAAAGCGNSPDASSSQTAAQVKGTITLAGKPVSGAEILFNPSNINRKEAPVARAPVKEDGSYELKTLVGQNQISLTGPGIVNIPQLAYFTQAFDVKPGDNELNIAIP